MIHLADIVLDNERFQRALQRYAHSNGSSDAVACAAVDALGAGDLVEAAELGLACLESSLSLLLESHCLLNDDLTPRPETLDRDLIPEASRLRDAIAKSRAAIEAVRP